MIAGTDRGIGDHVHPTVESAKLEARARGFRRRRCCGRPGGLLSDRVAGRSLLRAGSCLGPRPFYLEVRPSNIPARRMYERFGFRQLGMRRDYYPSMTGREDALFLGLNLAPRLI